MMTINRLQLAHSRKVSDLMTMLSSISRSTPRASRQPAPSRLRRFAFAAAASFGLVAASLTPAKAQQTPTAQPIIVADFNHDGIPDALVVSTTSPTATIAFGSVPYGTFSTTSKAVTFPAACTSFNSAPLSVGDFNNDGYADIVFFCNGTSGVLLGNGDGTFAAPKPITGAISANALVGDFNKDGKLDLVLLGLTFGPNTTAIGTFQFFAGSGDGTFGEAVNTQLDSTTYSAPLAVDLNSDGYLDIAVLNVVANSSPSVAFFGNNQDGTFGTLTAGISTPNTAVNVGASAAAILAGHFFSPTSIDVAVAATGANGQFYVIKNASTATDYAFGDPVTIPYAGLTAAKAGSFTGSGFTDLVASNGTTIAALANDGTGNFAPSYPTLTVASTSPLFAVADANGDGYSDIYTASSTNGALALAANVTTGTATATSQPFSLSLGTKAVSASWNGNTNLLASTATGQQIVNGAVSVIGVTSSKNPSTVGDSVTFSVAVASFLPADTVPTGTVNLMDGTTSLASGTLDGNGNFSYTTTALTMATHPIKAIYAGDNYYAASTSPVLSQVVNHAPAVASNLTWATPTAIVYGTALSGAQLNAAAADANGAAIPGAFVYTPAAGTVLDAGTKTLSVTFTPTDLLSFLPATKTVSLVVTQAAPVLTWATPASIVYGVALSGTQLNATVVGVTGAALPGAFAYTPAAGAMPAIGTQTLSVSFVPTNAVDYTGATGSVQLVVNPPNIGATVTGPPTTPPGTQTGVTVALSQAYPVDLVGTLTIGFTRSTSPQLTDPSLQLVCSDTTDGCAVNDNGTVLTFTVPANSTTIPAIMLQAGTIAGTITVPLTLTAGGVNVTPDNQPTVTIQVPTAAPTISGMTVTRSGQQLTVVMHGFSNTREMASAQFHFTAAPGATLGTADLMLPADTIFTTDWFNTDASDVYGSTFTYTQIFNTSDDATTVGSVDATLTNTVGVSNSATAK